MKRKTKGVLIALGTVLFIIISLCAGYVYNNMNFHKRAVRQTERAGFSEKTAELPDGTVLNYGEGGSGIPLLLIHGQGAAWTDYAEVLPRLAETFHVFIPDCYGHGKSTHDPAEYTAAAMGKNFAWFIENIIGTPAVVSGHSSGGLLAAWLAANKPELVTGVVLEDPPFFSSEAENAPKSFAWNDSFTPAHDFLNQDSCRDYSLYYLEHCMWINYFGPAKDGIIKTAEKYRAAHGGPLKIFYMTPSITRPFLFLDDYDPEFGNAFYNFSWFADFDHRETLARIKVPAVLIHNNWSIGTGGILLGAMSDDYARAAVELMADCTLVRLDSGHNSHAEKTKEFAAVLTGFTDRIDK